MEVSLLFDANLSPKLVNRLSDLFPGSKHVFDVGFVQDVADETIWAFAAANDFVIVTADSDFLQLSETSGAPPKVVHLSRCDYRTAQVEILLRRHGFFDCEPHAIVTKCSHYSQSRDDFLALLAPALLP